MADNAKKHEEEINEAAATEEIKEVEAEQDAQPEVADAELAEAKAELATKTEDAKETDAAEDEDKHTADRFTKAGKHSAKAVREAEAEAARQEAKEQRAQNEDEPKPRVRQMPNPLHQHGKKYRKAAELVDRHKAYDLDEALELARKTATTKFDASIEFHVNLGVDPRQADQMVRSSVVLPHGTGKDVRVAVYADGKPADDAKAAGADIVGTDKLLADIEKGKLNFDMLIATPAAMATLGKVAKILGPRGLMPNPKSGTVTPDVAKAVKEAKAGKVEFRIDKQAIVHQAIGKASFDADKLHENAVTFLSAILKAKPAAAKGTYVKALHATASMGPGIKLDASATIAAISAKK